MPIQSTLSSRLREEANKKKLAASKPARKVGAEATKPKPTPRKQAKPVAPPPVEEDEEEEVADSNEEEEEVQEEEDEQQVQEAAPVVAKARGSKRPATQRVAKKAAESRSATIAPDMELLSLFTEYNSVPPPASTATEVYPSYIRLIEMNAAVGSIFAPLRAIEKDKKEYNSVYSRLAICLCAVYRTLAAREFAKMLTYDERKVLKALREGHSFEDQLIPAPYAPFLKTFGYCDPGPEQFDAVVPALPAANTLTNAPLGNAHPMWFPNFPALTWLSSVVSGKNGHQVQSTFQDTAAPPAMHSRYVQDDKLVLFRTDNVTAMAGTYTYMGWDLAASATRNNQALSIYNNIAFIDEFPEDASRLAKVRAGSGKNKIPIPAATTGNVNVRDLMEYFSIKDSTRWIIEVMDALSYEAKFFEGSHTLGSFGIGAGPEILTIASVELKAPAYVANTTWGEIDLAFEPQGIELITRMNLSDMDMKVAALTCPILSFPAKANHPYNAFHGVADYATRTDVYPYNNTKVKRIIYKLDSKSHLYRIHVRSKMMKEIRDVIGN
nr:capsid protein [Sarcosphaera coronaria partitivirus]